MVRIERLMNGKWRVEAMGVGCPELFADKLAACAEASRLAKLFGYYVVVRHHA